MRSSYVSYSCFLLLVAPSLAAAQAVGPGQRGPSSEERAAATVPAAEAARRNDRITIDGRLDEPAWSQARPARLAVQGLPVEGAPAEYPTEVRVLYDDEAIYVAAVMYDPEPRRIADQLVRRDERGQYDYFELSLDPNNDRRTGYRFRVSAAGVQRDVYLFDDVREDDNWDAVWESKARRNPDGWSVELRIPLSQIRYDASDDVQTWGVNFSRRRLASNEVTYLALESRVRHGKVSAFGTLHGLRLPRHPRRIELRPYALTHLRTAPPQTGDPFFDGSQTAARGGMDLRYGLGAAFTLDLTLNPDFGQVEVDPAVINLTAFETFFPEKRPFFVEDAQVFDFTLSGRTNRLFYSRRIGREPHGSAPGDADFSDVPTQTTILGAAKVTGRTSRGLSIGALAALTAGEEGRMYDQASGELGSFPVEPRSQYGAFRVKQDFRGGASQFGAIATAMRRELQDEGAFDYLPSDAYSVGLDFEHSWGGARSRDWVFWGFWAGSLVRGSSTALTRIQRASNHYFQRPDATRFSVDSAATELSGMEWRLQFERRSAKHWTGSVWLAEVTPGFEVNDLGFSNAGERLDGGARIGYQEITPGRIFRSYRLSLWTFHNVRHEALDDPWSWSSWTRAHKRGAFFLNANVQFLNYWGLNFDTFYSPRSMSDVATRGGPLMIDPQSTSFTVRGNTDARKSVVVRPNFNYVNRFEAGYQWRAGLPFSLRPAPSVEIELQPTVQGELDPAQYVASVSDPQFAPTYGRRYIFSDLKRYTVSMQSRVNLTFSPRLTFQLFAQPLLSSGDYLTYKQLAAAETFDFDTFEEGTATMADIGGGAGGSIMCSGGRTCVSDGRRYVDYDGNGSPDLSFSDRDFNFRSLRMNAVLRWEYRPGSTVFLVWQQNRSDVERVGTFELGRDVRALWDIAPDNVFIVKLNYWLGL